jgi:hypothetical protein
MSPPNHDTTSIQNETDIVPPGQYPVVRVRVGNEQTMVELPLMVAVVLLHASAKLLVVAVLHWVLDVVGERCDLAVMAMRF